MLSKDFERIHFLGIGGAGLSPLAGICLELGLKVTGSDATPNERQAALKRQGAQIWSPHNLENLQKIELPDLCVYSTAIPKGNPEYLYLKEQGVKFFHRSDLLQELANSFEKQIVITGTHGKTTTTAMLAWILEQANLDITWVLGGVMAGSNRSYRLGKAREFILFEGDESDQSFLKSNPYIGLVTSLEPDHLENYHNSFDEQVKKFQEFAGKCKKFICSTEASKYFSPDSNLYQLPKENSFTLQKLFGEHNYLNASGALSIAEKLFNTNYTQLKKSENSKTFFQQAAGYLQNFPGIHRRFEIIKTPDSPNNPQKITVIDDYAHHPSEVKVVIQAAQSYLKEKELNKLIILFQPHLPTRLRDQWQGFIRVFKDLDPKKITLINDLYIARGEPIKRINSENLVKEIDQKNIKYIPGEPENLIPQVQELVEELDLVLILGAGNITRIRDSLIN